MTEEEALIRAREAALPSGSFAPWDEARVRAGEFDKHITIQSAKRALLDLNKPLPVDRDLADLRELMGDMQAATVYPAAADSYRNGHKDGLLRPALPTFRAIIQRRIEEAGK